MRPLSETLIDLIGFAEGVVIRPARGPDAAMAEIFAGLSAEVRQADARPAEAIRTTSAALIMVTALAEFFATARAEASPWLMVAGATLPLLRSDAWRARQNEREARAS